MHGVARNFFTIAIFYSLVGMTLGLSMAMAHDHSQMPTHAHIMVLGWLMSAIFAVFYHLVPAAGESRLAQIHFWLAALSSAAMFIGLFGLYAGQLSLEPVLGVASLAYFAATLLFGFIALRALWMNGSETAVREARRG